PDFKSRDRRAPLHRLLSRRTERASGTVSKGGADQANAFAAALRGRRLQLPASGYIRKMGVPLPGAFFLERSRTGIFRRGVHARGATPARAVDGRSDRWRSG